MTPMRFCCSILLLLLLTVTGAAWSQVPPVQPGFPNNLTCEPGELLYRQVGLDRVTNIIYHNGVIYSNNVGAGARREWLFSDANDPTTFGIVNDQDLPFMSDQGNHGHSKSGDYAGGALGFRYHRVSPGVNEIASMPSEDVFWDDQDSAPDSGMHRVYYPWATPFNWIQYGPNSGTARLWRADQLIAEWEPLADHGIAGNSILLGNLLFIASDASMLGVVVYDIGPTFENPPRDPQLIDKFTGSVGGYLGMVWENYLVLTGGEDRDLAYIIDYSDPTDLRLAATFDLSGTSAFNAGTNVPYVQTQDEFVFARRHKINMENFDIALELDEVGDNRPAGSVSGTLDVSQYTLPVGNLLISGGYSSAGRDGVGVWCHQSAPDRRSPYVGYHIPRPGQTGFPVGAPVSLVIAETLESFTIINGETVILRPVGGSPVDAWTSFSHDGILTITPKSYLQPDTTYEVIIPADGIRDVANNGIEPYAFTFSTGNNVAGGNLPATIQSFTVSNDAPQPGDTITFSVTATDPDSDPLEYRFTFGDGSPTQAWSSSASAVHTYTDAGHYEVKVQVRDLQPGGGTSVVSELLTASVTEPVTGPLPTHSSQLALDAANRRIWAVNPDNDSVAIINADTRQRISVVDLRALLTLDDQLDPVSVAVDGSGRAWIALRDADRIVVLDSAGALVDVFETGYGSSPQAVVSSSDGSAVYASVRGRGLVNPGNGQLLRFDAAGLQQTGSVELGPFPGPIAVSGDGSTAFVARFLSAEHFGEVWEVDTASMTRSDTIELWRDRGERGLDSGGADGPGVPNYIASLVLSPQQDWLWYSAIKMDTNRGLFFKLDTDNNLPLAHDSTVRAVLGRIDLTGASNLPEPNINASGSARGRVDIDNADSPSAIAFSSAGDYVFTALQGNDTVAIFDDFAIREGAGRSSLWRINTEGGAPQALLFDDATGRLWIKNFMARNTVALDLNGFLATGDRNVSTDVIPTTDSERLTASVLDGKRLFYFAGNNTDGQNQMSFEGYISCATCHIDGGHDGRVWDFTQRGEGLRNTTVLNGRSGILHGNVHWTGNFDEIQDFVNDIQNEFRGLGFLPEGQLANPPLGTPNAGRSAELDNLASYLMSLDESHLRRSPYRTVDGDLTAQAQAGEQHFLNLSCDSCHVPLAGYTDSTLGTATLHDVGTIRTSSGRRLDQPLSGFDTPSLLDAHASPPYLHDGSAETIGAVFQVAGGEIYQFEDGTFIGDAQIPGFASINQDSAFHGTMVSLGDINAGVTVAGLDGGSGGVGEIEVRFWPATGGTLRLTVNGAIIEDREFDGEQTHFEWQRMRFENVPLNAGLSNSVTVTLVARDGFEDIGLDDVTVSTSDDLASATAHRSALALSMAERCQLETYVLSLDRTSAGAGPQQPSLLFRNGFESP